MDKKNSALNYKNRFKLIPSVVLISLATCIIPVVVVLPYFNISLAGSTHADLTSPSELSSSGILIYNTWMVFGIAAALITGALAFVDYASRKDVSGLLIGSVLIAAGLYDLLCLLFSHLLPAQRRALDPYEEWLISRGLQVALLSGNTGYFLFRSKSRSIGMKVTTRWLLLSGSLLILIAAVIFSFWLNHIQEARYSYPFISHPAELIILLNYLTLALIILPGYNERYPSLFAKIVLWSIITSAIADVFMWMHEANFDAFFNTAYFIRFVSYGIPLIGIATNYIQAMVKQRAAIDRLHAEIKERIAIQKDLEQREASLAKTGAELENKIKELKRSNSELEQFAYAASHDIQEPLRKIKGFGDLLFTKYAESLPEQGRDYLGRIRNASERLQRLIDDILSLSQLRKAGNELRPIVLSEIIRDVLADLEYQIEKKNARIEVNAEINIRGIPVQIQQLFQNLVHNSLKFSRHGIAPDIRIVAKHSRELNLRGITSPVHPKSEYCLIEVKDNGIGFDIEDAEKIFNLFHRLHSRSEYEGSGLGLALCKKITDNHYGYIEAEGREGEGAIFRVYLPV